MSQPYLRPQPLEDAPLAECAPGHVVEPAGMWKGRLMEVVYDPCRHDVAFVRGELSEKVRTGLVDTGWEHRLSHGSSQMWVRDRLALARRRLRLTSTAPAAPKIA